MIFINGIILNVYNDDREVPPLTTKLTVSEGGALFFRYDVLVNEESFMIVKIRNRGVPLVVAAAMLMTSSSGFVKTYESIHAAANSVKYGDANGDGYVDALDLAYVKNSILKNANNMDKIIMKDEYAWQLEQYITGATNVFIYEKVIDSDGDKISDWDEVNLYGTNPNKADSDDD